MVSRLIFPRGTGRRRKRRSAFSRLFSLAIFGIIGYMLWQYLFPGANLNLSGLSISGFMNSITGAIHSIAGNNANLY